MVMNSQTQWYQAHLSYTPISKCSIPCFRSVLKYRSWTLMLWWCNHLTHVKHHSTWCVLATSIPRTWWWWWDMMQECLYVTQAAISWRASGNRQISLNASAERAFANFRDKKHRILQLQIFATKTSFLHIFALTALRLRWQPCASVDSPALALAALR